MIGALASTLAIPVVELLSLVVVGMRHAASIGFLRLATLALAQAFDLATFSVMVARHGGGAEANPIVGDLFGDFGMPAVVAAKLALVILVGSLSIAASARSGRGAWSMIGGLPLALAITAGLIGGITNTATFLR